jgi:hypothetical protein
MKPARPVQLGQADNKQLESIKPESINMAESTRKTGQAKKAEGAVDPSKIGKEMAASADENEVQGHTIYNLHVVCPYCHSDRFVDLEYEGEFFTCGNCGNTYRAWY